MARFIIETEKRNGWCRWVPVQMKGYKMACCDCGLVHDMDFYAVKVLRRIGKSGFQYTELPRSKYRVVFRARRNRRSTAAMRRGKSK